MNVASAGNDVGSLLAENEPMSFDDDPVGGREQPTEQADTHDHGHTCHLYLGVPCAKEFAPDAGCSRSLIESLRR